MAEKKKVRLKRFIPYCLFKELRDDDNTFKTTTMNKRNLLNIGLLLLIGILVLLVIYEPGIEAPTEDPLLLDINRDVVRQIRIERQGQETVAIALDSQGRWQMSEPIAIAASDYRMNALLGITEVKSLGNYPTDSEHLSSFGLATPRVTLTLNGQVKIAFGDNTALDQRRYVQVGDRVHLITDTLYYHLIGNYTTFIRQELLPEGSSVSAITLPDLAIRWKNDQWQIDPKPEAFSADQITRLIDAWKFASAIQVKPYDGKIGETIIIEFKDREQPLTFLLTASSPDLVLARPELGIQYHLAESSAEELLKLPKLEKAAVKE